MEKIYLQETWKWTTCTAEFLNVNIEFKFNNNETNLSAVEIIKIIKYQKSLTANK